MNLTVLGCGDAFGNGGRNNTSFLLSDGEGERVLIDCGASTLIRLKHERISLESISTIVISHFHGDHFGGIPFFLISSLFENPRQNPLTIVGPKNVKKRVQELQEAMYKGTFERLNEIDVRFHEYEEGKPLSIGDKLISAFQVEHSPSSIPHGIRLNWADKIVSFSGDTSWTDKLITLSDNADLFICECNFLKDSRFGHISYEELLNNMSRFTSKQLWITHMGNEVFQLEESKVNQLYDGMSILF